MAQDEMRHLFFIYLCSTFIRRNNTLFFEIEDMKKLLLMIAAIALLGAVVSCSGDDEPGPDGPNMRGDGVFTVNTPMVNHMYNTKTDQVIGLSNTRNKLTIDTVHHLAKLELTYNDGSDHTQTYTDLTATAKRLGFYELRSPSDASFSGYVDFNEGSMRYRYTTAGGLRIISTIAEVFFLKTTNTIEYLDTTETTEMENVMYQFNVNPSTLTALVKVMGIVHAKDRKYFNSITGYSVPVTLSSTGYVINGQNIQTNATYLAPTDSLGSRVKTTTAYPFKTFKATVDLDHDHLDARFMMGDSAIVTATGKTYPDYTSY